MELEACRVENEGCLMQNCESEQACCCRGQCVGAPGVRIGDCPLQNWWDVFRVIELKLPNKFCKNMTFASTNVVFDFSMPWSWPSVIIDVQNPHIQNKIHLSVFITVTLNLKRLTLAWDWSAKISQDASIFITIYNSRGRKSFKIFGEKNIAVNSEQGISKQWKVSSV